MAPASDADRTRRFENAYAYRLAGGVVRGCHACVHELGAFERHETWRRDG